MERELSPFKRLFRFLLRIVEGVLIGCCSVLPGVSGGVLTVTFGIYRPLMSLIAHPGKNIRKYWLTLLPVLIGWLGGFFGIAKVTEMLFKRVEEVVVCFFIGLIIGNFPALLKDAGREGRGKKAYISFAAAFILMAAFLVAFKLTKVTANITPGIFWFFLCGALWGVSCVAPGLSFTSLIIFLGLYEAQVSGIAALDPGVLAPMMLGMLVTVLLLSKVMDRLFERQFEAAMHVVLGIVAAFTLAIIPTRFPDAKSVIISVACAVCGFVISSTCDRLLAKMKPNDQDEEADQEDKSQRS
ncbi:MAG: DUF368 domain-containing protein [Oscillospiraceae bacterium]|nr:DUF368 domain-containing protein [Oscillospiraceae bacterium]